MGVPIIEDRLTVRPFHLKPNFKIRPLVRTAEKIRFFLSIFGVPTKWDFRIQVTDILPISAKTFEMKLKIVVESADFLEIH